MSKGLPLSPETRTFDKTGKYDFILAFQPFNPSSKVNLIESPTLPGLNVIGISTQASYDNMYTESDLKRYSNMSDFWYTSGDSVKAIDYCKKEVEVSKYLFGAKSNPYISKLKKLSDYYDNWNYLAESKECNKKIAELCLEIYCKLDQTKNRAKDYYVEEVDLDLVYEKLSISHNYFHSNKCWKDAKNIAESLLTILQRKKDTLQIPVCLYLIGLNSYNAKDEKDAEKYWLRAYDEFEKNGGQDNSLGYIGVLNGLCLIYNTKGDYSTALRYGRKAEVISKLFLGNDSKEYGFALTGLSTAELMLNMPDSALIHSEMASHIVEEAKDVDPLTKQIYRARINYVKASLNNQKLQTSDLGNIGQEENWVTLLYEAKQKISLENYEEAIIKLNRTRYLQEIHFDDYNFSASYIEVIISLSLLYQKLGNYEKADEVLDNSISFLKKKNVEIESSSENDASSSWFILRDTKIENIQFCETKEGIRSVYPKNRLLVKNKFTTQITT